MIADCIGQAFHRASVLRVYVRGALGRRWKRIASTGQHTTGVARGKMNEAVVPLAADLAGGCHSRARQGNKRWGVGSVAGEADLPGWIDCSRGCKIYRKRRALSHCERYRQSNAMQGVTAPGNGSRRYCHSTHSCGNRSWQTARIPYENISKIERAWAGAELSNARAAQRNQRRSICGSANERNLSGDASGR